MVNFESGRRDRDRQKDRTKGIPLSVLLFTGISALLLVSASLWVIIRIEQTTKDEIGNTLVAIRDAAYQSVVAWAREHRANAQILATTPRIVQWAEDFSGLHRDRRELIGHPLHDDLRAFLGPILRRRDYRGYFLLSPDNYVLSASRDIEIGRIAPRHIADLLKADQITISLPLFHDVILEDDSREPVPAIFVGTPVRSEAGRGLAFLVLRVDPWQEFAAIFQRGHIGQTGETYAFDRQGRLLSESRFEGQLQRAGLLGIGENSILQIFIRDPGVNLVAGERSPVARERQPLTRMAASAVQGEDGIDLDGYRDYRGTPVAGAWIGVAPLGLGIATEIDISEAYGPLRTIRLTLLILMAFSLLLLLGLAIFFVIGRQRLKRSERNLRHTNRELDAFVYTVSHDLRTPLTPILGYAEFILNHYTGSLDAQAIHGLNEIMAAGNRMLTLMEELLTLARAGEFERPEVPVDTRGVVEEVVRGLEGHLSAAGVTVAVGDLPPLHLPKAFLAQIFDNLIGNAIRYGCKPGDTIEVGGEKSGNTVRFHVRDHGPGIPVEERRRIFDVFYRGSTGEKTQGTGIGLATVQKIAKLGGGRTWVEETPGGGSTFRVEIADMPVAEKRGRARS